MNTYANKSMLTARKQTVAWKLFLNWQRFRVLSRGGPFDGEKYLLGWAHETSRRLLETIDLCLY